MNIRANSRLIKNLLNPMVVAGRRDYPLYPIMESEFYAHSREGDGTGEVPRPYPHLHNFQHSIHQLVEQFNEDEQQFRARETLLLRIICWMRRGYKRKNLRGDR